MTIQEKIAQMQTKRQERGEIWQNDNGTWSHRFDAQRQWEDRTGCVTDLRFAKEWGVE
jgi:hypothetical protein